jgi:hypothetical protein
MPSAASSLASPSDHAACAGRLELPDRRAAAIHRAEHIGAEHPFDHVRVGLRELADRPGDSRTVDEHLQRTERRLRLRHHARDIVRVGDIALDQAGLAAAGLDPAQQACGRGVVVAIVDRDGIAALRGQQGDRGADALGAPGNQYCALIHAFPLPN